MDNLEIGQWPLNVSRVSLLRLVLFIHMSISRGSYENVLFGERGGEKGWSKISSRPTHTLLFFTQGYAREKKKEGGGRSKQTKKIINHFVRRSDPAIILVSNKWCKRSQAWVSMG